MFSEMTVYPSELLNLLLFSSKQLCVCTYSHYWEFICKYFRWNFSFFCCSSSNWDGDILWASPLICNSYSNKSDKNIWVIAYFLCVNCIRATDCSNLAFTFKLSSNIFWIPLMFIPFQVSGSVLVLRHSSLFSNFDCNFFELWLWNTKTILASRSIRSV